MIALVRALVFCWGRVALCSRLPNKTMLDYLSRETVNSVTVVLPCRACILPGGLPRHIYFLISRGSSARWRGLVVISFGKYDDTDRPPGQHSRPGQDTDVGGKGRNFDRAAILTSFSETFFMAESS